jgi:hypothetical protein
MLRSAKDLRGYTIQAIDSSIGAVYDFYFDDQVWAIRYLVVETGSWLSGQRILLSPVALDTPEWETKTFPVKLTQEQVKGSPPVVTDKPVSRQMEEELHAHYGWPPYWVSTRALAAVQVVEQKYEDETSEDLTLRSMREVVGYDIRATDGKVGHVEDFVVDDGSWIIRYMVVDTRDWLPGRKVLVAPTWIEAVTWPERDVYVSLSRETVKDSPKFDPSAPVNREYELRLYDYYGRPKYWTRV